MGQKHQAEESSIPVIFLRDVGVPGMPANDVDGATRSYWMAQGEGTPVFSVPVMRDVAIKGQAKAWRFIEKFDLKRAMQRQGNLRTDQRKKAFRLRTGEHSYW
ncbi:unnamed protein product [Pylaiella littoralis]